jgi:S-adenosylmethionine decarboxylase
MEPRLSPALFSADLSRCAALPMLAGDEITDLFIEALGRAGATIVDTVSHAFPTAGLTCVVILRESHAVLHTWPETGTINIDIFSCTSRLRSVDAITALGRAFGAQQVSIQEIPRASGHGHGHRADAGA